MTESKVKNKILPILMGLIILAGIILRFNGIESECFAHDEKFTVEFAKKPVGELFQSFKKSDEPFTPHYYMFLSTLRGYFGESELVYRFPSVVIGILSLALLFFFCKKLTTLNNSLIITAIMSLNPTHFFYSQEARPYIFFFFFSLCFYYSLLLISNKMNNSKKLNTIYLTLSLIGLIHIHYFGIGISILVLPLLLFLYKNHFIQIIVSYIVAFLTYAPWIERTTKHFLHSPNNTWLPQTSLLDTINSILGFSLIGRYEFLHTLITMIVLIAFFLMYAKNFRNQRKHTHLFMFLTFIPIFAISIKSELTHPSFHKRYFIFILPYIYILILTFIEQVKIKDLRRYLQAIIFTILFILTLNSKHPVLVEKGCETPPPYQPQ